MKKTALIAALSASAITLSAQASFADYELTILHINDWHSRIESNNAFESTCSAKEEEENKCIGGAARLGGGDGIAVVRLVIPGLEGLDSSPDYAMGARARAVAGL